MRSTDLALLASLLAAAAGPASAAPPDALPTSPAAHKSQDKLAPTAVENEVVVTAQRADIDRTLTQIRSLSAAYGGQITRFETAVCPLAFGLPQAEAAVVEARIRKIAQTSGLVTGGPACDPNLVVAVAEDGPAFISALRRKHPGLFESLSMHEVERLQASLGPSWSWRMTRPARRDGGPVQFISEIKFGASTPPSVLAPGAYMTPDASFSRLSVPVRQDTLAAYVVLSSQALSGLTLQQVADYAAVAGLAAVRTWAAPSMLQASILTMFADRTAGRPAQSEASRFDRAFLHALYLGDTGFSSEQKSLSMAIQMEHDLQASSSNAKP